MKEMPKSYDHQGVEDRLYEKWEKNGYFHAEPNPDKEPYCIVIPPPNIAGQLHIGHAIDETLQDALIRYKRMAGFETLWLPGTDHASIATEVKIIEQMAKEGLDKRDIGREAFLQRVGLEKGIRRKDSKAAQEAWRQLRLGPRTLHNGRRLLQGRYQGVR